MIGANMPKEHSDQHITSEKLSHMPPPSYPPSFRRRPIVVFDPKTGHTRIVGGGRVSGRSNSDGVDSSADGRVRVNNVNGTTGRNSSLDEESGLDNTFQQHVQSGHSTAQEGSTSHHYRCSKADENRFSGRLFGPKELTKLNDEGRAPIMKIVSGYRGRQIVVRDPSRRSDRLHAHGKALGVRGGVRKAPYYYRRTAIRPTSHLEDCDRARYEQESLEAHRFISPVAHGVIHGGSKEAYEQDVEVGCSNCSERRECSHRIGRHRVDSNESTVLEQDEDSLVGRVTFVDNLSEDVTTTGLADLFGMVGAVKELRLLYDREGNPNGSADIIFQRRVDAIEAVRSLNNVPLNSRPMHLYMGYRP